MRKLDNLLTAVEVPGKVFKHGIFPVEVLHSQWIAEIEISKPGVHLSVVLTQQQILWKVLVHLLESRLLTDGHRNGSGRTSRACQRVSLSSGRGDLGSFGYRVLGRTGSPSFPLAVCGVLVGILSGAIRR